MKDEELQQRIDAYHLAQATEREKGELIEELGLDFHGIDLDGRDLSSVAIPGADFSSMTLQDVDFYGAHLGGANFSNATLVNVDFIKANLDHADFTNAKVIGGSWFRATCYDSKRDGLTFSGTNLERVFPELT